MSMGLLVGLKVIITPHSQRKKFICQMKTLKGDTNSKSFYSYGLYIVTNFHGRLSSPNRRSNEVIFKLLTFIIDETHSVDIIEIHYTSSYNNLCSYEFPDNTGPNKSLTHIQGLSWKEKHLPTVVSSSECYFCSTDHSVRYWLFLRIL